MTSGEQAIAQQLLPGVVYASLFGRFQLWAADGVEIVISNRRVRALLAMLCLAPDEPLERDYLSKLLWPGRSEAHAKASLRQCLLDVRPRLGIAMCRQGWALRWS